MAVQKEKGPDGYDRMKTILKTGQIGRLYVIHGEEYELRELCLNQFRSKLVEPTFEEFNFRKFTGPLVDVDDLAAAVDAIPMMSERSLIQVWDWDFWRLDEKEREKLAAVLSDLPDYCCLIFIFDQVEYKPDGRQKKLAGPLERYGEVLQFRQRQQDEMLRWIRRQFLDLGRDIDVETSRYLMFLCGTLMAPLRNEIGKIAHYAREKIVTREDVDAVATPTVEAVVFDLTDAISERRLDDAVKVLAKLLEMKDGEPLRLLAVIGKTIRGQYLARLMLDQGRDEYELAKVLEYRSTYPAKKLMNSARKLDPDRCMRNVRLCSEADFEMKQTGVDRLLLLEQLVVRLCGRA